MTAVRPVGPGIDRRRFLTASLLGLDGVALAGCQSAGNDSASAAATVVTTSTTTEIDPTWTFTDDMGGTVTLPKRPERIAGLTDQVAALWGFGIKPVAAFGYQAVADDVQFTGLDTSGVQAVGATYGEINMLYSLRAMTKDAMMAQPTFAALPAAAAGQVYPWEFMSMDYRGQAIVLGNLAENLSAARKVV